MRKLTISKKYHDNEDLKKELGIAIGYIEASVDFTNICLCDIRRFRKIVHTILDYKYPNIDNTEIHKEISNNNFTKAILLEIVDVEEV